MTRLSIELPEDVRVAALILEGGEGDVESHLRARLESGPPWRRWEARTSTGFGIEWRRRSCEGGIRESNCTFGRCCIRRMAATDAAR